MAETNGNGEKKPQTIDERLEALTHSCELIAAMQKDNEKAGQAPAPHHALA